VSGQEVTLIIDGREVTATEGEMLHDAARRGDVEIPVFCYEPKLGDPVGACRMCLVEVEGIPKLQTSCSTPVRDGMVVHTRTEQVKEAQSAVVEFLLVNHPLDCPVCDKGGECPLQDITMGWGPGSSRVIDEKRHFEKPIELSPLVAIDRERCILCYRCVRFSQEVAEDEQLQLLERGDRTFVGTFDDRPYIAPFHGNITDLCPVGALTSYTYRFRARPWDIEQAGSVCTLCPSQCNVSFTVRDEQVKRVVSRDNPDVDDGWLCDRGRYGFEMFGAEERVAAPRGRGGELAWQDAIEAAAKGLWTGKGACAAIVGDASNEEGYLVQRIMREALDSPNIDSGAGEGPRRETWLRLADPKLSARVRDIDQADVILVLGTDPLHSSPIIDLRIRKAMRRNTAQLVVATDHPTALDGGAEAVARYRPGGAADFLEELKDALESNAENNASPIVETVGDAEKVVIVWGEQLAQPKASAVDQLFVVSGLLNLAEKEGSGLLEIPTTANARGLREAGCLPDAGPGFSETTRGAGVGNIRSALARGEIKSLILFGVDPLRDFPDTEAWKTALAAADHLVVFSTFENATTTMADVVFPLETHAEKDGTITHPDGRLQRVRPSAARPGDIRPNWGVLAELALALGQDTGVSSQPSAFSALCEAVPFYAGLTDAEIGGRGIRWQDREAARALPAPPADEAPVISELFSVDGEIPDGPFELGTYRDLWAGPITELNPPLRFLAPQQRVEIAPADAESLGLKNGDEVRVGQNGSAVNARISVKERIQSGVCFLIEGTSEDNANLLAKSWAFPTKVEITKVGN
jgi:NADH-quinone oxidoreductase subunit G